MKKYFILISAIILFSRLNAQVFKLYTTNDGLISNTVKCSANDNAGNLWIGTTSSISRFDGNTFTSINSGLAGANIKTLHCDASGIIWVGTQTGLSKYNGTGFTNYFTTNGLPNNNITALASDANNLWIGTYSSGISKFDGTNFTNYNISSGLIYNNITSLCFNLNGKLWIGTLAGVSVYDGTGFTNYLTSSGLPSNNIKAIVCDNSGNMLIGTANGLSIYNGTGFTNYSTADGLLSNSITTFGKDNDGNIWIGYSNVQGITKFNGITFSHYQIGNGFTWQNLTCIKEWNNNIYAGCSDGLIKFKKNTFPPYRFGYLDTNNVAAAINANGIYFEAVNQTGGFLVPKNTGKSSLFASSIWFGGFDQSNLLHLAAQRFLFQESDIAPGPIFSDLNTYAGDSTWNRIWRISKAEIDYHIANYNQPGYVMPRSIQEWPAPTVDYVDVNNNHIYDPQNGDYPLIRGDLAMLTIFNDLNISHTSGGMPLGVEVHAMAYSFNSNDSALANTVFVNYKFYNYSANDYHDFYVGVYSDIDIGLASDDYIGCDSTLSMYFGYNGDASDADYGTNIPAQGVVFLSSPMYAFDYYNNSSDPATSDPQTSTEYYNVLNGFWKNGTPYTYGGTGIGGTTPTNYCFSGDPNNPAGWSEVTISSTPGDRRGVGSIGPFSFLAGKALCVDLAFPNAISYSTKNNLSSVNLLKERTSQIKNFYNSQGWDCGQIYVDSTTSPHLYTADKVICKDIATPMGNIVVGGNPPYTYNWSPATGLSNSGILNPSITISQNTTYSVTVTDSQGNTASGNVNVVVSIPEIHAGNDTIVCNNQTVTLHATPTGYNSYFWSNGQYTQNITVNTSHSYNGLINFTVYVIDSIQCSNIDTVTVNFLPAPNVFFGNDTILCNVSTLLLDAGTADHYLWSNGSTSQTILVDGTVLPLGVYNYSVHTWNDNGCESYDTIHVQVDECNVINDLSASGIKIYPNPGDGTFYIETAQPCEIKVLNDLGKVMLTKQINPNDNKVALKNATKGIYMIEIKTDKKTYKSKLIIK